MSQDVADVRCPGEKIMDAFSYLFFHFYTLPFEFSLFLALRRLILNARFSLGIFPIHGAVRVENHVLRSGL